jgi:putative colanic acid biosynthesis acetyltransferase WcaF
LTETKTLDLSEAPGEKSKWGKPAIVVYIWYIVEWLFVTNALQVSSTLRVAVLRLFGANIGHSVIFRPRTRVKFPWNLTIGDRTWIGEGVWFHNQDQIIIGTDVVISQETMLTCGSHAHRIDMGLITKPIVIDDGVWVTSRCLVLGGTTIGASSVISPMLVISGSIPPNIVWGSTGSLGPRFKIER